MHVKVIVEDRLSAKTMMIHGSYGVSFLGELDVEVRTVMEFMQTQKSFEDGWIKLCSRFDTHA